jgi:hypothetical protein
MSNYYRVLVRRLREHLLKGLERVSKQDPKATCAADRASCDAYNNILRLVVLGAIQDTILVASPIHHVVTAASPPGCCLEPSHRTSERERDEGRGIHL